jgi:hypothetical protein
MQKRRKILMLIAACALVALVSLPTFSRAKAAPLTASRAPFATESYYVDYNFYSVIGSNGKPCVMCYAIGLGERDAQAENNEIAQQGLHCQQAEWIAYTIIDFGSPQNGYINNWAGYSINYGNSGDEVANIAASYATGWYTYSYNCFILDLIIGVNNSYICGNAYANQPCDGQAGGGLANDANTVNQDMSAFGYAWQILGKAGIDAEAYWDSQDTFGSYAATNDFATGYTNYLSSHGVGWNLYDFGAAGSNCTYSNHNPAWDWCWGGNGSLAANVYWIAWGLGWDEPFPEAYNSGLSSQWEAVNSYSNSGNQGRIQYSTVMLDGSQSNSSNCSNWSTFISDNGGYIPSSSFYATVQQPLDAGHNNFFHC